MTGLAGGAKQGAIFCRKLGEKIGDYIAKNCLKKEFFALVALKGTYVENLKRYFPNFLQKRIILQTIFFNSLQNIRHWSQVMSHLAGRTIGRGKREMNIPGFKK